MCKTLNKSGETYVEFIIKKDEPVSNVKIIKEREFYPSCNEEALGVISSSLKWVLGMQNGRIVRAKQIQKASFNLLNSKSGTK